MKLLRLDSSPMGPNAISRQLTGEFVQHWLRQHPGGTVFTRDLTTTVIPAVTPEWVAANYTPKDSRTPQQKELLSLSTELIAELHDADEYVVGTPVHNFGPPSCLKLWVDHIVTPSSSGTLRDKRATFLIVAGRVYRPGSPDASHNHLQPWLRTVFSSLGVTDMQFIFVEGTVAMHTGKIDRATFLAPHLQAIHALFTGEESPVAQPFLAVS